MLENRFSNAQLDKLGERLKSATILPQDLAMFVDYRELYLPSFFEVKKKIEQENYTSQDRPSKTVLAVCNKLRRETIRLSQIHDIAGCRIITPNLAEQDKCVSWLVKEFNARVLDRRSQPSHHYRAVHCITLNTSKKIEIQVRTILQHEWATFSEKLSAKLGEGLKYGVGDEYHLNTLRDTSFIVEQAESLERNHNLDEAMYKLKLIRQYCSLLNQPGILSSTMSDRIIAKLRGN